MNSSDAESDELPLPHEQPKDYPFKFNFASIKKLISNIFPLEPEYQDNIELDGTDAVAILFFTALGMITRIFRIQFPSSIVYEEGHYGNLTNSYLRGQYFHDNHPPLAKLIMTGIAHYAGYNGEYNFYKQDYPTMTYVAMRMTPAFFGALCVPLSYLLMRFMKCSHFASFFSAILIMSDLSLIVEARHYLFEGILHFFICLSIFSIFLYERTMTIFAFIFEGFCLGCMAACKYTSGGVVIFALIRQFCLLNNSFLFGFIRALLLCLIISIVHLMCFTVHLMALPFLPDEVFLNNSIFIPKSVRNGLVDRLNSDWDARAHAPSLVTRAIDLVCSMIYQSFRSKESIPHSSRWYSWPLFNCEWIPFWSKNGKFIICLGNVLLWYPVFIGIVWNLIVTLIRKDFRSTRACLLYGYLLSLVPFALVPRSLCLYNYAIPLIFGVYNLAMMIEKEMKPVYRGFFFSLVMTMAIFGYFHWSHLAYGLTIPDLNFLIWNKKWAGELLKTDV